MPTNSSAIPEAIQELVSSCQADGADITTVPKKPLTFTNLVKDLEKYNLFKPTVTASTQPKISDQESALASAHRMDVRY